MDEVLGNQDLARYIMKQSPSGVGLLRASKRIRSNEPCASYFENWSRHGCPTSPAIGIEADCLAEAGRICEGEYRLLTADQPNRVIVDAHEAANRVTSKLLQTPMFLQLKLILANTTVIIIRDHRSNRLLVTRDGWRSKGRACTPSDDALSTLIHQIMTANKGTYVHLPCTLGTSAFGSVLVPHAVQAQLEWIVDSSKSNELRLVCSAARV